MDISKAYNRSFNGDWVKQEKRVVGLIEASSQKCEDFAHAQDIQKEARGSAVLLEAYCDNEEAQSCDLYRK